MDVVARFLLVALFLIGIVLFIRFVLRLLNPRPTGLAGPGEYFELQLWACARCDSSEIRELPKDQISPYPSFECRDCGFMMRPRGSGFMYSVVLVIGVALFAGSTAVFWAKLDADRFPIGVAIASVIVISYCIRQLVRPVVRRSQSNSSD